jgi:hypothetical protein
MDAGRIARSSKRSERNFSTSVSAAHGVRGWNGWPDLSTANRYATSFRATARVAGCDSPRSTSRACIAANCGFHRGASFAASISTVCKCALRCFEIGPRF